MKLFRKIVFFLLVQQVTSVSHHAFVKTREEWSQMKEEQDRNVFMARKKENDIISTKPTLDRNKPCKLEEPFKMTKIILMCWGIFKLFF